MSQQAGQSSHQRRFKTTNVYKRSRQYFDISRLNKIQHKEELSRRKPQQYLNQTVKGKFEDSFMNSEYKLHQRVHTELTKCSTKGFRDDEDDPVNYVFTDNRKGKTLDMDKMLPRQKYQRSFDCSRNQHNFCNFTPFQLPQNHTINFSKYTTYNDMSKKSPKSISKTCGRCKTRGGIQYSSIPSISEPQIGKIRQKLHFDQTIFKTLVNLKRNNKEKSQRSPQPQISIDRDRIQLGQQVSKNHMNTGMVEFYHGNTKWQASQMESKLTKEGTNFLRAFNKAQSKKKDWLMHKRKADMVDKRLDKILARKNIKDVKGQICDQLYFRRNKI